VTLLDPVNSFLRSAGFRSRSAWKPASPASFCAFYQLDLWMKL
jgi:hypothetical protein